MEQSPNEKLIAYYDGDEIIWITPPEYYVRQAGRFVLEQVDDTDAKETD